ncbi:ankyrin repeat domain-containing protein [Wolbachia endosymbiont of Ctenocephalides felis wCfeJ]|uniref:ankyrin repeat domain-containing protein n=1 Tax=Wolbachia endosymbiont of Ctenocephalides felis wCfeJ TaxID=2732594 RepID=UPI0014462CF3|nr:ankyrin repeat domain-containing protein [Wolbachia endosymbiont of Ctenocephalides felis wCfeJ]WCR58306.1 MAG: Actin-binding protein [Wolbachia endosymbiont of Ctenocephalides felis wCfeJ]
MRDEQWWKILSAIKREKDLNGDNIIEKIKEKLKAEGGDEYKKWKGAGFDVNYLFQVVFLDRENGQTLLHLAARDARTEIVRALLKVKRIDVNIVVEEGWTPLHLAAKNGQVEIVSTLVERKANVNAIAKDGNTPLHDAAILGHIEVVKALLANGADSLLKDKHGRTPRDLLKNESGITPGDLLEDEYSIPIDLAANDIENLLKEAEEKQLKQQATTRSFIANCIIKHCCCSGTFRNRDGCS